MVKRNYAATAWLCLMMVFVTAQAAPEDGKNAPSKKAHRDDRAAQDYIIQEADNLIKAGKAADAYQLLEPMEFERSGELHFDYLLGVAALDSGKPDRATIAFERILAVNTNVEARLDMARAYYQLGALRKAKTELDWVMQQNPSQATRDRVQKYLSAIDEKMSREGNKVTGYLETTVGHDTNIILFTNGPTIIYSPLFGAELTLSSYPTHANYYGVGGGANLLHPVNDTLALYVGADGLHRTNEAPTSDYDVTNANTNAGAIWKLGQKDSLKVGALYGQYFLGNPLYYKDYGISGEWNHVFNPAYQSTVYTQGLVFRFSGPSFAQNFIQYVEGVNLIHSLPDGKTRFSTSVFLGHELATLQRPDGDATLSGARFGALVPITNRTDLFGTMGWNNKGYQQSNPVFGSTRRDILVDATVGVNWHWDNQWTVRPQMSWSKNNSSLSIYSYDRLDISVTLRSEFN